MKYLKKKILTGIFFSRLLVILPVFTVLVYGRATAIPINFTPEHLWQIQRVGNPVISPDGKTMAFTVTAYDIEKNNSKTNIYLMDVEGTEPVQFTRGDSDNSPVWSPDGKHLAFISGRGDGPAQLYVIPANGGEARKITTLPVSVQAPKWFPDGIKIAFTAGILPEYEGDFDELEKMLKEKKENKVTAKVTEDRVYKYWDRWLTDGIIPRLFSVDLNTNKVTDLMPETDHLTSLTGNISYDISPDGQTIALSINSTPVPYDRTNYDIYLLQTDSNGSLRNITPDNPANDLNPMFSPDGQLLLFGKQTIEHFYADNVKPVFYDMRMGTTRVTAHDVDLSFGDWIWSDDGRQIYFNAEDKAVQSLFVMNITDGAVREIHRGGTAGGMQQTGDNRLVFTQHNLENPPEIFIVNRDGSALRQMTFINKEILQGISFGKSESVYFKGADDADVQMYIIYPPDFDPGKKYPMLMLLHGGPHGIFGDSFHFRWNAHLFASPGYVTVMPNFHGSTSFGQDFAISIHGAHGEKPFIDVMNAADYMIEKGIIDEARIAAAGGSYGGYLVSYLAGHTDRFAALINHAGVYNIMQQFGSDVTSNRHYAYDGAPWENLEQMQRWNPAVYAENFVTPMLIIHGQKDYRVPVTHAFEVYGVYKGKGLDARLVYYPDENHFILKPQNSIFWYRQVYEWLERYIK
jgi:dipeptidyl aminopeptidase/acylaminoacyl peptidase